MSRNITTIVPQTFIIIPMLLFVVSGGRINAGLSTMDDTTKNDKSTTTKTTNNGMNKHTMNTHTILASLTRTKATADEDLAILHNPSFFVSIDEDEDDHVEPSFLDSAFRLVGDEVDDRAMLEEERCRVYGESCLGNDSKCCDEFFCNRSDMCTCRKRYDTCNGRKRCCGDLVCDMGQCVDPPLTCNGLGQWCGDNEDCCGEYRVVCERRFADRSARYEYCREKKCGTIRSYCENDGECCSSFYCNPNKNQCACKGEAGKFCSVEKPCCFHDALTCNYATSQCMEIPQDTGCPCVLSIAKFYDTLANSNLAWCDSAPGYALSVEADDGRALLASFDFAALRQVGLDLAGNEFRDHDAVCGLEATDGHTDYVPISSEESRKCMAILRAGASLAGASCDGRDNGHDRRRVSSSSHSSESAKVVTTEAVEMTGGATLAPERLEKLERLIREFTKDASIPEIP